MKTPFRQKNRSKGSYTNYILLVGAIFIIGAVFFSYSDGLMVRVLSPIYKGENAFAKSFVSIRGFFRSKDALIQENQILKEHLASDEAALSASRAESSSADMIIQSLGRVPSGSGVLASVLVHPPETPYDMLLVDAGQDNGVLIGQKVALSEGAEIGTVTEVFKKNARVNLYSSSGTETNAVLERNAVRIRSKYSSGYSSRSR
jgi:cell shape-determining protein MreC